MKLVLVLAFSAAVLASGCGAAPESSQASATPAAAPSATPTQTTPPVNQEYRDKVIANAANMYPNAPDTAREAYAALDGGESSPAALKLGGMAETNKWVRRFEGAYEVAQARRCLERHFGSMHFTPAYAAALAASPDFDDLVADAQQFAPEGYARTLGPDTSAKTNEQRATAAIAALMLAETVAVPGPTPEDLTLLATSYMVKATGGACVESPEFAALLSTVR
jgi:hypothetical protein